MKVVIEKSSLVGEISAISSKSDVCRFLFGGALAKGKSRIFFTTLSKDIKAAIDIVSAMGARVELAEQKGGYTAEIFGIEETGRSPLLNAAESGTAARLALALSSALFDEFTLLGEGSLASRPFEELCHALSQNGAVFDHSTLPIKKRGRLHSGSFSIRGDISSQYISGLLFALPLLEGDSKIILKTPLVSKGYVDMTVTTLALFGIEIKKVDDGFFVKGGQKYLPVTDYRAEGDWSSSAFWLCSAALSGNVTVNGLDPASHQKDKKIIEILRQIGARVEISKNSVTVSRGSLCPLEICGEDISDLAPPLGALLAFCKGESRFTSAPHLKLKESNRILSIVSMINSLGGSAAPLDEGFKVSGVEQSMGGSLDSGGDHRIAMSAAIMSGASEKITLTGAQAVEKSYPTFFDDFKTLGGKLIVYN